MLQLHLRGQHNIVFNDDEDLHEVVDRAQHNISMLMDGFKLIMLTLKQIVTHILNFRNVISEIRELKNG